MVTADEYDRWYGTPRGAWIGQIEFRLLRDLLQPQRGASLLDVGCGTGYFTRRFAAEAGLHVVGLDPDVAWLAFARAHAAAGERYCGGRAEALPFDDHSFDYAISVTALCFVDDIGCALAELVRITRRRFAIGLLNRASLLHRDKGRAGGTGAYRGARWHTVGEVRALFGGLPVAGLAVRSAVFQPSGGVVARAIERVVPSRLPAGAFLVAAGIVRPPS